MATKAPNPEDAIQRGGAVFAWHVSAWSQPEQPPLEQPPLEQPPEPHDLPKLSGSAAAPTV